MMLNFAVVLLFPIFAMSTSVQVSSSRNTITRRGLSNSKCLGNSCRGDRPTQAQKEALWSPMAASHPSSPAGPGYAIANALGVHHAHPHYSPSSSSIMTHTTTPVDSPLRRPAAQTPMTTQVDNPVRPTMSRKEREVASGSGSSGSGTSSSKSYFRSFGAGPSGVKKD
ncbi:unnamed protein product [Sympodiomycopsis kandeliae]